jgi:hypothetical protein
MNSLRIIVRLMRRAWLRWSKSSPETRSLSSIDLREFSDLLASGRKDDLKTLADRLSHHARAPQGRVPAKSSGRHANNSKGSGITK